MSAHTLSQSLPHHGAAQFRPAQALQLHQYRGLTVGLTCAIFIILFVRDELSYDSWIPGSENLYRVELTFHLPGRPPWPLATAPFPRPQRCRTNSRSEGATHLVPER